MRPGQGVIATWWTDTLPDFKTLLENGFPGVIDGWVDAIADAVEDDEAAGPTFDPFGHKLVRRTWAVCPPSVIGNKYCHLLQSVIHYES